MPPTMDNIITLHSNVGPKSTHQEQECHDDASHLFSILGPIH